MRKAHTPEQVFAQLGDVWQKARGARAMPARTDINPIQAGAALHYAALLDVVPGTPVDFRYRLLGQHMIDAYGRNLTGSLHTQTFPPPAVSPICDGLARCVQTRQPQEMVADFRNSNGTPCRAEVSAWPLSDDGGAVTGLLVGCIYVAA